MEKGSEISIILQNSTEGNSPPPHQPKGKAFRTHPPPPLKKESLKTKQNNRQQKLVQSISQKGGIHRSEEKRRQIRQFSIEVDCKEETYNLKKTAEHPTNC